MQKKVAGFFLISFLSFCFFTIIFHTFASAQNSAYSLNTPLNPTNELAFENPISLKMITPTPTPLFSLPLAAGPQMPQSSPEEQNPLNKTASSSPTPTMLLSPTPTASPTAIPAITETPSPTPTEILSPTESLTPTAILTVTLSA